MRPRGQCARPLRSDLLRHELHQQLHLHVATVLSPPLRNSCGPHDISDGPAGACRQPQLHHTQDPRPLGVCKQPDFHCGRGGATQQWPAHPQRRVLPPVLRDG
ncbi:unnamed protein product [Symbiodinium microadriaticum]|nr:unnamed protein product [Symbiodinium microadriaticum]